MEKLTFNLLMNKWCYTHICFRCRRGEKNLPTWFHNISIYILPTGVVGLVDVGAGVEADVDGAGVVACIWIEWNCYQ